MSTLLEDLHRAAFTITPLITKPEYEHMKQAWEMVLGGLIAPAMLKEDPSAVGEALKPLLERYTPEKVRAFFMPKKEIVEKRIKEVVIKKVPTPGEMHRRIKDEVKKVKRADDLFRCADRDIMIRWWNDNQALCPEDDPVCVKMTALINAGRADVKAVYPPQVAGYISHLARMGLRTADEREKVFNRSIKRGKHSVMPVYTEAFIKKIIDNRNAQKAEAAKRAAEHKRIREERGLPPKEAAVKTEIVSTGIVPDPSAVSTAPLPVILDPDSKPKKKRIRKAKKEPAVVATDPLAAPAAAPVVEAPAPVAPVAEPKSATLPAAPVEDTDPLADLC